MQKQVQSAMLQVMSTIGTLQTEVEQLEQFRDDKAYGQYYAMIADGASVTELYSLYSKHSKAIQYHDAKQQLERYYDTIAQAHNTFMIERTQQIIIDEFFDGNIALVSPAGLDTDQPIYQLHFLEIVKL